MSNNLNDLEMAKKRDHKIMITDEAINKVPRVQYKEISETEYDNLQELARQVLQISKDENDSNEVAVTYSLESARLIEKGERYIGIALGAEHDVGLVGPLGHQAHHVIGTALPVDAFHGGQHPGLLRPVSGQPVHQHRGVGLQVEVGHHLRIQPRGIEVGAAVVAEGGLQLPVKGQRGVVVHLPCDGTDDLAGGAAGVGDNEIEPRVI